MAEDLSGPIEGVAGDRAAVLPRFGGNAPVYDPQWRGRTIDPNVVRQHLGAIDGLSEVDVLEAIVRRLLGPTAAMLRAELAKSDQ